MTITLVRGLVQSGTKSEANRPSVKKAGSGPGGTSSPANITIKIYKPSSLTSALEQRNGPEPGLRDKGGALFLAEQIALKVRGLELSGDTHLLSSRRLKDVGGSL